MQSNSQIYLGKNGKVFGPFSASEYQQLSLQGNLSQYTWIWDWTSEQWKVIETPPAPLKLDKATLELQKNIIAVCFNHSQLLRGRIELMTDDGCFFVLDSSGRKLEHFFALKSTLELNLFSEHTQKSTHARVSLEAIKLNSNHQVFQLKWLEKPIISIH